MLLDNAQIAFQVFLDASPDCILVNDFETLRYLYVNDAVCTATGYTREELLNMDQTDLTGQTRQERQRICALAAAAGTAGYTEEPRMTSSKDGSRKGWWQAHHRVVELEGRRIVVVASREVTKQVLAERAAEQAKRTYASLSATNEAILRSSTPEELFSKVCEAAIESGALTTASVLLPSAGSNELYVAATAGTGAEQMRQAVLSIDPARPEGQGLNGQAFRTGEPCISNDYLSDPRTRPWHDMVKQTRLRAGASVPIIRDGAVVGVLYLGAREKRAFNEEIISLLQRMARNLAFALQTMEHEEDRRRAEERVHYLATHDSLTGLPNRVLFDELLGQALSTAARQNHRPAVMFLDLDCFKEVNDRFGHAAGDQLLEELARRLEAVLRESDVLARLGGDEFVVLINHVKREADAAEVALKLLEAAHTPLSVDGHECRMSASIGIAVYPENGRDGLELMKSADAAMYQAKDTGKNTYCFFQADQALNDPA